MQDFRNIKVWQKSHLFVLEVYKATLKFPREEMYGLISQIRRASVSIPSNIAEGCSRNSDPEFVRYLSIAIGSASEVDYQVLLAKDLGYLTKDEYDKLAQEINLIRQMLFALMRAIKKDKVKPEVV
jgi:four helix bundle protein